MRYYGWLFVGMGLVLSLVGCGDSDGGGGSGGTGGSAGSGGTGGGASMVEVSGVVTAATIAGDEMPLEGATVAVVGSSNSATTAVDGSFSVMAPTGTVLFLTTADGHWGTLTAEDVPNGGRTDLEFSVIPDALVGAVADVIGVTVNPDKGLVAVGFDELLAVGGESASIDVTSEASFVFDADDNPVVGDTLIAGGGSEVIFVNVEVAGSVSTTATNASDEACSHEYPDAPYSVQAKVLTEIGVVCP